MKRIIVVCSTVILAMLSLPSLGREDVATFTPASMGKTTWFKLGQNDSNVFWYAYAIDDSGCIAHGKGSPKCESVYIAIKDATKGIESDYTALSVLSAEMICASYAPPENLFDASIRTYHVDAVPMTEESSSYLGRKLPIGRGTWIAAAVMKVCNSLAIR